MMATGSATALEQQSAAMLAAPTAEPTVKAWAEESEQPTAGMMATGSATALEQQSAAMLAAPTAEPTVKAWAEESAFAWATRLG
jgi:class 3 adenylate cyclase